MKASEKKNWWLRIVGFFLAYFLILIVEKHSYYNFAFKLQKTYADTNGRFIICDIEIEKKYIIVANVHAPSDEEPIFFQDFFTSI